VWDHHFVEGGEAHALRRAPIAPHPVGSHCVSYLFLFLAWHEACVVVGWSVRKFHWVIREPCSKGSDDAQGHLDLLNVCEFWGRKVRLIVLARERQRRESFAVEAG
jgi:hypothetical protein